MYRCDICNAEYKIKPDYCDCGNDTFTYIEDIKEKPLKAFPTKQVLSAVIFIICILLSFLVWETGSKTPEQKTVQKSITKEKTSIQIPDIEEIWDSTPPKNQPTKEERNIITVYEKPKQIIKNWFSPEAQKPQPKSQTAPQPKAIQKPKQNITTQHQNSKPQQVKTPPKTKQTEQKSEQNKQSEQKVQTPAPVKKQQQPQNSQATAIKPKQNITPAPKPVARMDSGEWDRYKNSLRYALLSKLDVVKITGEGDCAISFSFDANGKLLNRKFIYQSTNKSVNDQVYLMLMKLPVFNPPPQNYRGETVKMKFYINNGYYEISFIN